jgi:CRP-like cAMP-binding protein
MLFNPSNPICDSVKILSIFDDVASAEQIVRINAGEKIVGYDNKNSKVLIVKSGIIKLALQKGSKVIILGFCLSGEMLSSSLLNGNNSSYIVEAVTAVSAYSWELSKINEVANLFPEIKLMIHSMNDTWILWLVNRIESIGLLSPKQRVHKWLSDYLRNQKYFQSNLWKELTVHDMAAYCAVTNEEFTFHLNSFIASGKLKLENNIPTNLTV